MLRREMVCHPRVIDNRQSNQPLLTRPWQRRVARQKYGKACCCYCKREYDKSDRLQSYKRSVRFGAVREIGAGQPVTNPKQGSQAKIQQIEGTRLGIRIPMGEPEDDGREPKRTEHPEPVPNWSAYPRRRRFPHPWGCRCNLNYGSG